MKAKPMLSDPTEVCALFFCAALAGQDKLPLGEVMDYGFQLSEAFISEVKRRRQPKRDHARRD